MSAASDSLLGQLADLVADRVVTRLNAAHQAADQWIALRQTGLPVRTLRRAIRSGELAARKIGRSMFVRRDAVDRWVEGQTVPQPTNGSTNGTSNRSTNEPERERLLRLAMEPRRRRVRQ